MEPKPLTGTYRGVIVDSNDPLRLNRYRVHVYKVDQFNGTQWSLGSTAAQVTAYVPLRYDILELILQRAGDDTIHSGHTGDFSTYPWAEVMGMGAKNAGLLPVFVVGDLVWVIFEDGERDYPVIVGGWTSNSFGFPDLIAEKMPYVGTGASSSGDSSYFDYQAFLDGSVDDTGTYAHARLRWSLVDRRGSMVELSELGDEAWIKLASGNSDLTNNMPTDSVEIDTQGFFYIDAPTSMFRVQNFFATTQTELILSVNAQVSPASVSSGDPYAPVVGVEPLFGMYSSWKMDLWAADELDIGQYLARLYDAGSGSNLIQNTRLQTRLLLAGAYHQFLGVADLKNFMRYSRRLEDPVNTAHHLANVTPTYTNFIEAYQSVEAYAGGVNWPSYTPVSPSSSIAWNGYFPGAEYVSYPSLNQSLLAVDNYATPIFNATLMQGGTKGVNRWPHPDDPASSNFLNFLNGPNSGGLHRIVADNIWLISTNPIQCYPGILQLGFDVRSDAPVGVPSSGYNEINYACVNKIYFDHNFTARTASGIGKPPVICNGALPGTVDPTNLNDPRNSQDGIHLSLNQIYAMVLVWSVRAGQLATRTNRLLGSVVPVEQYGRRPDQRVDVHAVAQCCGVLSGGRGQFNAIVAAEHPDVYQSGGE